MAHDESADLRHFILVVADDRDPPAPPLERETQLEHQAHSATTAGLAADVVMDERDVAAGSSRGCRQRFTPT